MSYDVLKQNRAAFAGALLYDLEAVLSPLVNAPLPETSYKDQASKDARVFLVSFILPVWNVIQRIHAHDKVSGPSASGEAEVYKRVDHWINLLSKVYDISQEASPAKAPPSE
jgi:hypothetical protein